MNCFHNCHKCFFRQRCNVHAWRPYGTVHVQESPEDVCLRELFFRNRWAGTGGGINTHPSWLGSALSCMTCHGQPGAWRTGHPMCTWPLISPNRTAGFQPHLFTCALRSSYIFQSVICKFMIFPSHFQFLFQFLLPVVGLPASAKLICYSTRAVT